MLQSLLRRGASYAELTKLRLSSLVVASTSAGYCMDMMDGSWAPIAIVCGGTALCAMSASAFNQVRCLLFKLHHFTVFTCTLACLRQLYEVRTDSLMMRTHRRPLVTGAITKPHALAFGAITGIAGVGVLYTLCNPVAAVLGAVNIGLYRYGTSRKCRARTVDSLRHAFASAFLYFHCAFLCASSVSSSGVCLGYWWVDVHLPHALAVRA
jgi:heme O synthase-like polyprenyltransferase